LIETTDFNLFIHTKASDDFQVISVMKESCYPLDIFADLSKLIPVKIDRIACLACVYSPNKIVNQVFSSP
jgi:hypothetical protein